jgi:hypothetical protein
MPASAGFFFAKNWQVLPIAFCNKNKNQNKKV